MLKKVRQVCLLSVIAVVCAPAGSLSAADAELAVISPDLLRHAGLRIVWEKKVPIKQGEQLEALDFIAARLYAISDNNYVTSLDRQTGRIVFARSVAARGIPIPDLRLHDNQLLGAYGRSFFSVDPETGKTDERHNVEYSIVAPPARNESYLYISGSDNRLHVLTADRRVEVTAVAAEDSSRISSILADNRSVVFATDSGRLVSMDPQGRNRLWGFDVRRAIIDPIVRDNQSLYFVAEDMYIYRLDTPNDASVALAWKYQVPGFPVGTPRVTSSAVYQVVRGKGVVAVDKNSGRMLWRLPEGAEFMADGNGRAYVFTHDNTLAVMHNATGRKLYEVNFAPVSITAPNLASQMIYVANESGWVLCLAPAG